MDKTSREYVVCPCLKVTRGEITDFIKKTGITDLKTICAQMPVGNKCGGCREMIEQIIAETLAAEDTASGSSKVADD